MPDRSAGRRPAFPSIIAVIVLAGIVVGCGAAATSAAPASGGTLATAAAAATTPAATDNDQPLVVDAGLLGVLPTTVDGVPMTPVPETAAGMIGDAALARSASAVAVGVVVAPGDSQGDDLAITSVIQLRPGVFSDEFYRGWRESYDTAACEPAGGVASHVQQLIGTHTVEVTVCGQGARTYHTHLPGDRLVSITAVGDRSFGDLVMAGLRQ